MAINSIANLTDSTVAGSNTQIQYNNSGVFGASSNLTFNGTDELQLTDNTKLTLGTGNDADIYYDGTNLVIEPQVVGSGAVVINDAAKAFLNDTANANTTVGLTLNQGANDDEIISLKSSDVAHGMTSNTETDTFGLLKKSGATNGGCSIFGYGETTDALILGGFNTTDDTTKSLSGNAIVTLAGAKKSGTTAGAPGSDANIVKVSVNSVGTVWLVDKEGDVHYDGTTNATAWDDHDDLGLLNTVRNIQTGQKAQHIFGTFVSENAQVLHDTGVVTLNDDGHHFVSTKGLNALIIDTIRQEGQKWRTAMDQRDNEIAELRGELMRLQERN